MVLGFPVGLSVGACDGILLGCKLGLAVDGDGVGPVVVGCCDGSEVGSIVGNLEGITVGSTVGTDVGDLVGDAEGTTDGLLVGNVEGVFVG